MWFPPSRDARLCVAEVCALGVSAHPVGTRCNNNVIITSKLCRDVIMALLLRRVPAGRLLVGVKLVSSQTKQNRTKPKLCKRFWGEVWLVNDWVHCMASCQIQKNCRLRMRHEWMPGTFPRHRGLATSTCFTARCVTRDARFVVDAGIANLWFPLKSLLG